jgi:hypothetical protein
MRSICFPEDHETIQVLNPNVIKLMANGMKIFVKSPARIELFKNKDLGTPGWMPLCTIQKTLKYLFCGK